LMRSKEAVPILPHAILGQEEQISMRGRWHA
jgi:hypothetical protein